MAARTLIPGSQSPDGPGALEKSGGSLGGEPLDDALFERERPTSEAQKSGRPAAAHFFF
ncbi:MAG: hypothetical protein WCA77_01145 [Thermoplasmata archaeon]